MNAKTIVKRDEFGVFSEKNSVSKYWGVSLAKKIPGFTVRFFDTMNKETILFKPKSELTEAIAATIAARFHDARELYSITTHFMVEIGSDVYKVNNCTNTIELLPKEAETETPALKSEDALPHITNNMVNPRKPKEVIETAPSVDYSNFDFLGYEKGTMYFELTEKGFEIPS